MYISCFDVFYHALASLACEQSPKACLKRSASVDRPLTEPPQHPTDADMRPFKVRVELGRSHMCEYGACRGAEQRLGPSNPRVELVVESKRRRRRPPRPSHPRVDLVVESQRRVRQLLPPMPIENQWLLLPFAIGKIGTTIWKVTGRARVPALVLPACSS